MTKFQLNRADAPWDYPSLGFRADTGTAILDGSTFDPPITIPPDVFWSVYGGGSPESGITRYTFPVVPATPSVEPSDGFILAWDDTANSYRAKSPQEFIELPDVAVALNTTIGEGVDLGNERAKAARLVGIERGLFVKNIDRGNLFRAYEPTTGDILAVTTQSNGGRRLVRSADNGETWTLLGEPATTNTVAYMWFSTSGAWFAWASGLKRSTDQGVTWISVLTGTQAPLDEGFTQTPDGDLWLVEYMGDARVYRSADDGVTWTVAYNWPNTDNSSGTVIRHAHGIKSLPSGLWAFTGDSGSECGLWRWEGGTFVRKSPAQTDANGGQTWRAVGLTERGGFLYWAQDGASPNGVEPAGIFRANPADLAGTVTRLATIPTGGWYTALLPTGEILIGSVSEALGYESDQDARIWLITLDDEVMEVWHANRATTGLAIDFTAIRNLRVRPSDGLVSFTVNQTDFTGGGSTAIATVVGYVRVTPQRPQVMSRQSTPEAYPDTARTWTVTASTQGPFTTSAAFVGIPELTKVLNLRAARPVLVILNMDMRINTDGQYANVRLAAYNGVTGAGPTTFGTSTNSYGSTRYGSITVVGIFAPAAPGLWEVRAEWNTTGGAMADTRFSARRMTIVEM